MDELFRLPVLNGAEEVDGWSEETTRYRITPRPKSKFKTVLKPAELFGPDGGRFEVTTRVRPSAAESEDTLEVRATVELPEVKIEERFIGVREGVGVRASTLDRTVGESRTEKVNFIGSPFPLPRTSYPEVLLPFLMRAQPRDGGVRAAYSWTNDRFVARVYYERRKRKTLELPAGRFEADEVWMYPDLNDWIALGGLLTKLAKPLLPRYTMWFETGASNRVLRFEGPFGPPGAPEIVIELAK